MEQLSVLRSTAQRLNVTPADELPRIAGFLAQSLASCSRLGSEEDQKTVDFSGPLHRLRTKLSSLLQGRTSAERLAATILIKAYVELVKPVEASQWEAWGRGLITCLNKQDPWEAKTLYVITLTRMLALCRRSATLQREVVSPLLPAFLNASLAAVKPTAVKIGDEDNSLPNKLLPTALKSWSELLEHFSQTTRPFVTRMKQVCLAVLESDTSPESLRHAAIDTICLLHLCAPKATSGNDWDQNVANIILAAHQSLDIVFRGVVEDWVSTSTSLTQRNTGQDFSRPPQLANADPTGMKGWSGLYQGVDRTILLLRWLGAALTHPSQSSGVPLGALVDLMARITGITVPTAGTHIKTSSEVSKEEREELWANLPRLHSQTIKLVVVIYEVFGQATIPFSATISNQVLEVFESESWNIAIRGASYEAMVATLRTTHNSGSWANSSGWLALIKSSCQELMNPAASQEMPPGSTLDTDNRKNADSNQRGSKSHKQRTLGRRSSRIGEAARELLLVAYEQTSAQISHNVRAEMDRTAILVNDHDLLLASTMNPPSQKRTSRSQPSLLPFLVRSRSTGSVSLEALLRPRLPNFPAVQSRNIHQELLSEDEGDGSVDMSIVNDNAFSNGINDAHDAPSAIPDTSKGIVQEAQAIQLPAKRKATETMNCLPTTQDGDMIASELAFKRPRQVVGEAGVSSAYGDVRGHTGDTEVVPERELAPTKPAPKAFSGGDAITVHELAQPLPGGRTEVPDSDDDDSDIPEIDPELATDDEDE